MPTIKPKYKGSCLGQMLQLIGLVIIIAVIPTFLFDPFISIIGFIIGLVIVAIGGRINGYICPKCNNPIASTKVKLCPACKQKFGIIVNQPTQPDAPEEKAEEPEPWTPKKVKKVTYDIPDPSA